LAPLRIAKSMSRFCLHRCALTSLHLESSHLSPGRWIPTTGHCPKAVLTGEEALHAHKNGPATSLPRCSRALPSGTLFLSKVKPTVKGEPLAKGKPVLPLTLKQIFRAQFVRAAANNFTMFQHQDMPQ